jgi:ribosome maturation factor RimP
MSLQDRLRELVEPIVAELDLELFDLQYTGSTLSVLIQRRDGEPVDIAAITAVSRASSRALDEADPIPGRYTLEVSSPGLERPLRTPAHFAGAVGELVAVKTIPAFDGPRRVKGKLARVGDDGAWIEIEPEEPVGEPLRVGLASIEKARTVFEWGPIPPSPDGAGGGKARSGGRKGAAGRGDRGNPSAGTGDPPDLRVDGSAPAAERDAKMTADEKKVTAR